jgi:hypothetical protein
MNKDASNFVPTEDYLEMYNSLNKELSKYKQAFEVLKLANEFYSSPDNWSRRDTLFWESIDRNDCKDYLHITRDVRLTGGHRAREAAKKVEEILK